MKTIQRFAFMLVAMICSLTAFGQSVESSQSQVVKNDFKQLNEAQAAPQEMLMPIDETIVAAPAQQSKMRKAEGDPVAVTPPEGMTTTEMSLSMNKPGYPIQFYTVNVGVSGDDVYIQGFVSELPSAWMKGTKSTTDGTVTVTFQSGQYLGTDDSDPNNVKPYYVGGMSSSAADLETFTMTYDEAENKYSGNGYVAVSKTPTGVWSNRHYYTYYIYIYPKETLTEPPAGIEPETWKFTASVYYQQQWTSYANEEAKIVFDGNDVYMQGITDINPTAWLKGTKDENGNIVIANGQFLGLSGSSPVYVGGYASSYGHDIIFNYDGKANYISDKMMVFNGKKNSLSFFKYASAGASFSQEVDELVTVPENLEIEYYKFLYKSTYDGAERDKEYDVAIGFDGNDVYMKGVWNALPDVWIKGELNGETITFANKQYLGSYGSYENIYYMPFTVDEEGVGVFADKIEFTYNADEKWLESTGNFAITISKTAFSYFLRAYIPRYEVKPNPAAVPADPTISSFSEGVLVFNVPTTGTQGEELITGELAYKVYSDIEHEVEVVEFLPEYYTALTEPMTVIPYDFTDYATIGKNNAGNNVIIFKHDFEAYNRIGVQSIYTGGNETNESEIIWLDIKDYLTGYAGWVASEQGLDNAADLTSYTIDEGYTLTFAKGEGNNNPKYYDSGQNARVYKNNTFTIEGEKIIKVKINYTPNYGGVVESTPEGITQEDVDNRWVWEGKANKIDFINVSNASNLQLRINSIEVFYDLTQPIDVMTITPEEGVVEELNELQLTFGDFTADCKQDAGLVTVLKEGETEPVTQGALSMSDDNKTVIITLDTKITDAGNYTLTIPAGAIVANNLEMPELTFSYVIEDNPYKLVELPVGVTPEEWFGRGDFWTYSGGWTSEDIEKSEYKYQVAFDGNDVYIQGIDVYNPESWIKGTMTGTTVDFISGQFTGKQTNSSGEESIFYVVGSESVSPFGIKDFAFTYDAENGTLTTVAGVDPTIAPDPESGNLYAYYTGLILFKNKPEPDTVVTPPAGLQTEDYLFEGNEITLTGTGDIDTSSPVSNTVKVGFDGNDVYVQGISYYYQPDAWVKGVRDGDKVTFATGQLLGDFTITYSGTNYDYTSYFLGANSSTLALQDVVMNFDEATSTMTGNDWIVISTKKNSISYFHIFGDFVIKKDATGINEISADDANAIYYDTMGRRVDSSARGLLIKQTRQADGTVKTVKVMK